MAHHSFAAEFDGNKQVLLRGTVTKMEWINPHSWIHVDVVGTDGKTHDVRIVRSLGMGLDERSVETIRTWRFDPATKNGQTVAVQINVEVSFRLY